MTVTAKVELFFTSGSNGWSETYYHTDADLATSYTSALTLANLRGSLMGNPTTLDAIRVQDTAVVRASSLTPQNNKWNASFVSDADNPNVAAMMRLYDTANNRSRPLYLRGNPDDAFNVADPTNADAQLWQQNYNALGQFLSGAGTGSVGAWLIKFAPQVPIPTARTMVTAWNPSTPSTQSIVSAPGVTTGPGQFVTFYNIKGLPFPPGKTFVVSFVSVGGIMTVRYRTPSDFTYQGGGYVVPYVASYGSIAAWTGVPRWTRRATGRPSDVSRGRRRSIAR
jgi:hypothetical protein